MGEAAGLKAEEWAWLAPDNLDDMAAAPDVATRDMPTLSFTPSVGGILETFSQKKWDAAAYAAGGRLFATEIALAIGAPVSEVRGWLREPEFKSQITKMREAMQERAGLAGFQTKAQRAALLEDRLERVSQIVEERAASTDPHLSAELGLAYDADLASAAGGSTGLVVAKRRSVGSGPNSETFTEYELDAGLLKTEADLSRQLAGELGQWAERTETTVTKKIYIGFSIDDV